MWQELAGLLEKNQGITKLQLNSINLGDEVRYRDLETLTWSLVSSEVRSGLPERTAHWYRSNSNIISRHAFILCLFHRGFGYDLMFHRELKPLLKC